MKAKVFDLNLAQDGLLQAAAKFLAAIFSLMMHHTTNEPLALTRSSLEGKV